MQFQHLIDKSKKTNEILYKSANHQTSRDCESSTESPNNVFGYGTINALKAFELAQALYGSKVELAIE